MAFTHDDHKGIIPLFSAPKLTMKIGSFTLSAPVIAAPMAGVSDKPYRMLCREHGAGMVVSEMVTSRADLRKTTKTRLRMDYQGEPDPRVVQIVGTEPHIMAEAAQFNVQQGAQIIDINMGCPAKKVCNKLAGSALMSDEKRVADILQTVVASVDVPVTLKMRTGVTPEHRNAPQIACIAEDAGIQSLTIHGRTRQCKYVGEVEYDTIAQVKSEAGIPVVANGDITSPEKAKFVLSYTGADAVMIGRGAQGRPWLFAQVTDYLKTGCYKSAPDIKQQSQIILRHLQSIYDFYGDFSGVRFARKHIAWYLKNIDGSDEFRRRVNQVEDCQKQYQLVEDFFEQVQEIEQTEEKKVAA